MTRLHADPVEVRRTDTGAGPEPEQFLWRGRLYLVREVLARWTESGRWWATPAVRALTTGDRLVAADTASPPRAGGPVVDGDLDGERSWWRVEAGRGAGHVREHGTGVYDLCLDETTGTWTLTRVLD
ncbi:MAG TPA: DUF6504 family protein [Mycobacteriales bacterium]|nr:DUF6504 family protein [Mycobacteriales bacterium]